MLIIDCHAHLYADDPARYPVRHDPLNPPSGTGTAAHLRAESQAAGVIAIRAIQTLTYYGFDNSYLCDTARAHPDWVCGVATLDPDNPASPALLKGYVRESGVKSLRSIPSGAHRTFDDPGVRALWRTAADEGITIDLFLMHPDMVPSASKLLTEFPQLIAGFCHCLDLKPGADLDEHLQIVLSLARFPNLYPRSISSPPGPNSPTARRSPRDHQNLRRGTLPLGQLLPEWPLDPQGYLRRTSAYLHRSPAAN